MVDFDEDSQGYVYNEHGLAAMEAYVWNYDEETGAWTSYEYGTFWDLEDVAEGNEVEEEQPEKAAAATESKSGKAATITLTATRKDQVWQ